jgi:hypothetical protein
MRLCKGTTEGLRRVRQLDGGFLFGHERIVTNPEVTHWGFRIGGHSPGTGQLGVLCLDWSMSASAIGHSL